MDEPSSIVRSRRRNLCDQRQQRIAFAKRADFVERRQTPAHRIMQELASRFAAAGKVAVHILGRIEVATCAIGGRIINGQQVRAEKDETGFQLPIAPGQAQFLHRHLRYRSVAAGPVGRHAGPGAIRSVALRTGTGGPTGFAAGQFAPFAGRRPAVAHCASLTTPRALDLESKLPREPLPPLPSRAAGFRCRPENGGPSADPSPKPTSGICENPCGCK